VDFIKYSRQITKASRSNFYYAFLFLPKKQREALYAVYAFCRLIDDVVDRNTSPAKAMGELKQWREQIARCYEGQTNPPAGRADHPILTSLSKIIQEFHLPREYFEELINGVEMDLHYSRYTTFEELYPYCYRVAAIVGLICAEIFGYTESATRDHAIHQGIAFQLTNILRDVKSDAARGRIYLPLDDLKRFGYSEQELLNSVYNQAFVDLMCFECQRAKNYYHDAKEFLSSRDRPSMVASEIMGGIYYRILQEIERSNFNVFGKKISLPGYTKLSLALKIWLANRLSKRPPKL
jgi:phytoene synthase